MPFDMPGANAPFEARGGWLVNALAAKFDLTTQQAAGIVGNLGFESGGFKELQEISPAVEGSLGGFGWAQWTGPRRRSFMAWCETASLRPASDEANFGYLCAELSGAYRNTIIALKECGDVTEAVWSVGQTYERPGGTTRLHLPGYTDRLAYARRALSGAHNVPHAAETASPDAPAATPQPTPAPAPIRQPSADPNSDDEAQELDRQELDSGGA